MLKLYPARIGLRYTSAKRKNHFISFISLTSMVGLIIGVALLITVLSVMNGFDRELQQRILGMVPHAVIKPYSEMTDWKVLKDQVMKKTEVLAAAPFINAQGMVTKNGAVHGVQLNGILPKEELGVSIIAKHMVQGDLNVLQPGEFNIVIGQLLARQLQVAIGDKVTVVLPEASLTPAGVFPRLKRFTVKGVFKVGADLDSTLTMIHMDDAAKILSAFNINVLKAHVAMNADEAVAVATNIGFPVALKLRDSKLRHHSDIQAVLLHLNNAQEVIVAATSVIQRVQQLDCEFSGFIIQKMALTAGAQEIRVAVINDSTFGPVICIGEGGSEWQPLVDAEVALPPLNMTLARYSVQQALNRKVLKNRYVPQPFNIEALCLVLCQISDMIIACPQIEAIDFNPILMKGNDLTVLDVNVTLMPQLYDIASKLTIMPYPKSLESYATLKNGQTILMRPILPEDEPNHLAFDNSLSAEDRYKRYFGVRSAMTHEEMAVLTQIDYAREMAFIAVDQSKQTEVTLGAIRATIDPDNIEAEFAMAVRTNYQGQGIGRLLLVKLIEYYRTKQTKKLTGYTMLSNRNMASLAKQLGFKVTTDVEDGLIYMELIY